MPAAEPEDGSLFTVTLGVLNGVSQATANTVAAVTQAAADYWGRYIDTSLASIDIQVDFLSLGDTTLAQAGSDFFFSFSSGGLDFFEPTTINEIATGDDLNGSAPDISIEVNLDSINLNEFTFGPLVDGVSIGGGGFDLWTVLVHEIAHGLGLLTFIDEGGTDRTTFDQFVTGSAGSFSFNGPDPDFGPIPLDSSIAHTSIVGGAVLNPSIAPGFARYLTAAEVSIFGDIGATLKRPTNGADDLSSFGTTSNSGTPNPTLRALGGNDTLTGLPTADRLFGDDGDDVIFGSNGNDSLDGGEGADTLRGDNWIDTLNGGNGIDTADYSAAPDGVFIDLEDSSGLSGAFAAGDVLNSIEVVIGSALDDNITGGSFGDVLSGGAGVDALFGGNGDDTLDGGANRDMIFGGLGNDLILGGAGNDSILGQENNDSVDGGTGNDTVDGGAGNDSLFGGNGFDSLIGSIGADTLSGFVGKDTLVGDDDADLLLGGDTGDDLSGGAGNDTLRGDAGSDALNGGDRDEAHVDEVATAGGEHGGDRGTAAVDQHQRGAVAEGDGGTAVGRTRGDVAVVGANVVGTVEIRLRLLEDLEDVGVDTGLGDVDRAKDCDRDSRGVGGDRDQRAGDDELLELDRLIFLGGSGLLGHRGGNNARASNQREQCPQIPYGTCVHRVSVCCSCVKPTRVRNPHKLGV